TEEGEFLHEGGGVR
nr:RecName: Full=Fibrinogen alpha chain; Contains: RecName: Full=Fibrinopeptide A [Equus caballus]prf//650771J fibrinopeptide A [Equus caballus]prf//660906A fibrinopeptide A [Equus caballus]